jgi:hypothetical protein
MKATFGLGVSTIHLSTKQSTDLPNKQTSEKNNQPIDRQVTDISTN